MTRAGGIRRVGYAFRLRLVFAFMAFTAPLGAAPRYAAQLANECDVLMSLAVRRPYGVGWADAAPEAKPKAGVQPVNLTPPGTAAAGFVLFWAGDLLDNTKYKQTAYDAVRGMIAARHPTGQIPAQGLFRPANAGGRDAPTLVADRAATRAALGLALSLLDESGGKDETLRRDAASCLNWLLTQQTPAGAWPLADPPAGASNEQARLVRLDLPDFRDCVFAALLANEILEDPRARRSAENAARFLLRMRLSNASALGASLWSTAYALDATPSDRLPDFPRGVDALASRQAMQVLLAAHVMLGDPPARGDQPALPLLEPLTAAARAVSKLPKFDGKWVRVYAYDVASTPAPPSTRPVGFDKVAAAVPPARWSDTFGLDTSLDEVRGLTDAGREKYRRAVSARFPLRRRLAAALCGLDDEPFSVDMPVLKEGVAGYVRDHAGKFQSLDDPPPTGISDRVRRLYLLMLRANLERME